MGPSWGQPGPSRSRLEAPDGHRKRNENEKAHTISGLPSVFEEVWLLGGIIRLGKWVGILVEPSWADIGAYWNIVGCIFRNIVIRI